MSRKPRHWHVWSPGYDYYEYVGGEAVAHWMETDYAYVVAPTRREAIRLGVAEMKYWPQRARDDDRNPFVGVVAQKEDQ
jgi:hypothetical protein